MVSILNSSEVEFIYQQTSALGNFHFWIGLYRNKTTSDPKEGWVWSDGSNFTNPQQWLPGEPHDYLTNEDCAKLFAKDKRWDNLDCSSFFSWICKRKKGNVYMPSLIVIIIFLKKVTFNLNCNKKHSDWGAEWCSTLSQ